MAARDGIKLLCLEKELTFHSVKVSSSPNSPLLFALVFCGETNRSSLSHMFFKIDVLKSFINFTGKRQCLSLFLTKLQAWAWACTFIKKRLQHRGFSVKFANSLGAPSLTEHLQWLLLNKPRRSLWFICQRDFLVIQHKSTLVVQTCQTCQTC